VPEIAPTRALSLSTTQIAEAVDPIKKPIRPGDTIDEKTERQVNTVTTAAPAEAKRAMKPDDKKTAEPVGDDWLESWVSPARPKQSKRRAREGKLQAKQNDGDQDGLAGAKEDSQAAGPGERLKSKMKLPVVKGEETGNGSLELDAPASAPTASPVASEVSDPSGSRKMTLKIRTFVGLVLRDLEFDVDTALTVRHALFCERSRSCSHPPCRWLYLAPVRSESSRGRLRSGMASVP
jgi:hypothetical protein